MTDSSKLLQIPDEITFMVQIATSSAKTEIKPENFKGLNDIVEINAPGRFKYASGNFTDYSAAVNYRKKMKTLLS